MKKEKKKTPLRKWEHLEDARCIVCKTPFVAKKYWAYGGEDILKDYWVISSVYCSTKCSRKGHKMFSEAIWKKLPRKRMKKKKE